MTTQTTYDENTPAVARFQCKERVWNALTTLLEITLIVGVFAAYGAWPIPDVNEQYYVGKAIHFWNHDWLGNDPFLNTPDSHWLFYACFGLLSFLFKQNTLVWVGRVVVWSTTAIAWRRLSRVFFPTRWISILTAAAFAFYLESFHLAGEWIFGGVEGKGFAFPFVFWGLACFIEGKYNRAWILYGIGSAFHALVGGWAVLASLVVWALDAHRRYGAQLKDVQSSDEYVKEPLGRRLVARLVGFGREFKATAPGLFLGGAISLLGVIPALRLDMGATAAEIAESRQIYVFERLSHHLVASSLPWTFLTRFSATILAFAVAVLISAFLVRRLRSERTTDREESNRYFRLETFVLAALLFAAIGATIDWGAKWLASTGRIADPKSCAGLLRYYWYRLSDWAVPFGLVFVVARSVGVTIAYVRGLATRRYMENDETCSTNCVISKLVGASLVWFSFGFLVYLAFRTWFFQIARTVATSSAVDGLIPLPKPTEAPAFMATVFACGAMLFLGLIVSFITTRKKMERDGSSVVPQGLLVGLCVWFGLLLALAPSWRLATFVDLRGTKVIPRSAPPKESIADGWLDVCHWARDNTPQKAIFLVPRGCDSFKWEAQRAEAGSWKEIPQDAKSIVRWSRKMERFYANPGTKPDAPTHWNQPLVSVFLNKGRDRVLKEAEKYGYQYAILEAPPYIIATIPEALKRWTEFEEKDVVYKNEQFYVLKLGDVKDETSDDENPIE